MKTASERPVLLFYVILLLIILTLLLKLFFLQIIGGRKYRQLATLNHVRIISEQAPRGEILDRNNKLLATSRPVFTAFLYPSGQESSESIRKISEILGISADETMLKIKENTAGLVSPVLLKKRLNFNEMARLEEEKFRTPGLIIQRIATRYYPLGRGLAHVLGYVGFISPEELKKMAEEKITVPYSPNDYVGKSGMELLYEEQLRGKNGGQQIAVDVKGRPINILESIPPEAGQNLVLTIDSEMQQVAEKALGDKRGAIVVLDTETGEVLALVSHPAYDPNMFTEPINPSFWLFQKQLGNPFFNRSVNGYPPGSVFKLVITIAGLESGKLKESDTFYCPGFLKLGVRTAWCWQKNGHGTVDLLRAIINSCDVTFYNIGLRLGIEPIVEMARKFGFGAKTGIELPWEGSGTVPTVEWKKKKYHENWYPGDSINLAIGQGFIQSTPLQVALFMEALANNGTYYFPELIKQSVPSKKKKELRKNKGKIKILGQVVVSGETLNFVRESLRQVVQTGTGQAAHLTDVEIAGKTGTAEDPPRYPPHAWFACFAPYNKPKLAISVFVEQGGHGGAVAAPMAKDIIQWWYQNRVKEKTNVLSANN